MSVINKKKGNERGKKAKGLYWQNNNFVRAAPLEGGGGVLGFQVTGMIEGFFGGLKFSNSGFFGVEEFWQVLFWVA